MNKNENRSEVYIGHGYRKHYKTVNFGAFIAEILGKTKWGVFFRDNLYYIFISPYNPDSLKHSSLASLDSCSTQTHHFCLERMIQEQMQRLDI